jgi:hypothetical protein
MPTNPSDQAPEGKPHKDRPKVHTAGGIMQPYYLVSEADNYFSQLEMRLSLHDFTGAQKANIALMTGTYAELKTALQSQINICNDLRTRAESAENKLQITKVAHEGRGNG